MNLCAEQLHARSNMYHALAQALYEPDAEIQRPLLMASSRAARVLGSSACQETAVVLMTLPVAPPKEMRQRYVRATQRHSGRPLALYESLYREGRLMGQATRDVEKYYRNLGIGTDGGELVDHASVELSVLAHLTEAQAAVTDEPSLAARLCMEERRFLRRHPGAWLPAVGRELAQSDDPFYAAVGSLLQGFLGEELEGHWSRQKRRASIPVMGDAARCNLCGICVGTCQPRALRVIENESETALILDVSRCSGCSRCVRNCPQDALAESLSDTSYPIDAMGTPGRQILRRSPRARCPSCGCPTVSQSELAAVFSVLEADPIVQRQMSLCVACKSQWNSL